MSAVLNIDNLYVNYDRIEALKGISFHVEAGEIVCLLGANGAGKSTTLRAISGLLIPKAGHILFQDQDITGATPEKVVKQGIGHVPEGRQIFPGLTVMEHLELGTYCHRNDRARKNDFEQTLAQVFELFPVLKERRKQMGGTLSGGEQQMLSVGRALMSQPKLLLLDEPTMGVAPLLVKEILNTVAELPKRGISALLVEQNVRSALCIASRGYVLMNGEIALEGTSSELLANKDMSATYLGGNVSASKKLH
jgi:branched-chain amino acid transport system ATP-binding protein